MKKELVRNIIKVMAIATVIVFLILFIRQPIVGKIMENFNWKTVAFAAGIIIVSDIVIRILYKDEYDNERKNFRRTK